MADEYPKCKYHLIKKAVVVNNRDEEEALGIGWSDRPIEHLRRSRSRVAGPQACLKWVDEWPVPELSDDQRGKIKAQLLRADAAFCKSDGDFSAGKACMRRAFAGVAKLLFQAGILSERLLEREIPVLIMDAAVAGGWWPYASERDQGISSRKIGHYLVWWPESGDWEGLFRGATAMWLARLLEARPQTAPAETHAANDPQPRPRLDTDRIEKWMQEEGYDNRELAEKLHISRRVVSSMVNNGEYHGRRAIEKLAKLMGLDAFDLYRG